MMFDAEARLLSFLAIELESSDSSAQTYLLRGAD
jgi:hypothetical protein